MKSKGPLQLVPSDPYNGRIGIGCFSEKKSRMLFLLLKFETVSFIVIIALTSSSFKAGCLLASNYSARRNNIFRTENIK